MKTVNVQEASRNLSKLLRCAADGEEITIHDDEGMLTILLRLVSVSPKNRLKGREALRQLQSQSQLTAGQAENYLREVHAERLAHENGNGR
jgi:antitoxin (DNA-binding transcriptional repressor) of toxin-antitoxin stability system